MTLLKLRSKLLIAVLFLNGIAIAQDVENVAALTTKYKGFKVISKEHQKRITIDLKKGIPVVSTNYHDEYLILNQNGASMMGTDEIEFSSFHTIEDIDAYSLIPGEKGYKKVKATNFETKDAESNGSVFHDDNKVTSFVYPSLCKGAIRVLDYNESVSEMRFPFGFYFSSYLPVENATFIIDCDEDIDIQFKLFNDADNRVVHTNEVVSGRRILKWTIHEPLVLKHEERESSSRYYATNLMAQIASYTYKGVKTQGIESAKDLHHWYQNNIQNVLTEKPSEELTTLTDSIVKGLDTEIDKVKAVYYWVQNNIKYIAFEEGMNGFIPRLPSAICSRRYGDCKDMAALIYQMLKIAKVPAYMTWIGTRHIPFKYTDFASSATDNHMIATYLDGDKPYFLDATVSFLPLGYPSYGIIGKQALLHIAKDEYKVIDVPTMTIFDTYYRDTTFISFEGRNIIGKGKMIAGGFYNVFINDLFKNVAPDKMDKLIENLNVKGNNTFGVSNSKAFNVGDRSKDLIVEYDCKIDNYVTNYEDEVYLNMVLEKDITLGEIELDRKAPYYIDVLSNDIYTVILDVPSGYEVKYIPKGGVFKSDFVDYELSYQQEGNKITLDVKLDLKFLLMYSKDFPTWNEFVKVMKTSMSETIVLVKK